MPVKLLQTLLEYQNSDPLWLKVPILSLVVFLIVWTVAPIKKSAIVRRVFRPFKTYIKIHEAEALMQGHKTPVRASMQTTTSHRLPRGRSLIYASLGLCQALVWSSIFWYSLIAMPLNLPSNDDHELLASSFVCGFAWTYATLRPAMHPKSTPPYDLFAIYCLLLLKAIEAIGVMAYQSYVYQINIFSYGIDLFASLLNSSVLVLLLIVVFTTHIAIPGETSGISREAIGTTISPEDYTTLWKWITFGWMTQLTKRESLYKEEDVWDLSPMMATKALYTKYAEVGKAYRDPSGKVTSSSFFWHWWACNSLDIILEFCLSMLSLLLDFASPLFLKLILDCITRLGRETSPVEARKLRAQAMIYAIAAFACSIAKAGSDLHHLFYGRRAATRTRNEVMVAIYDKAMRRRDVITPPAATDTKKGGDKNGPPAGGADAPKPEGEKKKEGADLGKLVNLMSTDTRTLERWVYMAYWFYSAPIQLVLSVVFLYQLLGWSAFAGVIIFVIIAPLNHLLSDKAMKIYQSMQEARDNKMSVLNEMVSEIKFIKFLASEDGWMKRAFEARAVELKLIRLSGYVDVLFSFVWNCAPVGVALLSFWAYTWNGHRLSVATAFTAVQLFAMLSQPLGALPMAFVQYLRLKVSIERIAAFMSEDEIDDEASSLKRNDTKLGREATDETMVENDKFGILNGFFLWSPPRKDDDEDKAKKAPKKKPWWRTKFWLKATVAEPVPSTIVSEITNPAIPPVNPVEEGDPIVDSSTVASGAVTPLPSSAADERQFELRDINIIFPPGELSLVTGPTASGKTALLRALLGEMYTMPTSEGSQPTQIFLPKYPTVLDKSTGLRNYVSYAAQTPWLEHLTIKENILFGSEFDEARYKQVLECCALNPDLDALEDGDETEIGERGVSLSGGQKARVALARAVYAPTKYVLLDDPLSAVDSHTARFLTDRLLQGPLLAHRTVILVTHHVELVLPGAGYIIRMLDGRIDTQGSVSELRKRGILQEIAAQEKKEIIASPEDPKVDEAPEKEKKKAKKLIEEEERAQGRVKWKIYVAYIKASAYATWVALLLFTFLGTAMEIGQKVWMQIWGDAYETAPAYTFSDLSLHIQKAERILFPVATLFSEQTIKTQALPSADEHPLFYVGGLALIGLLDILFAMFASIVLILGTYRASEILFEQLLRGVMRATMRWQDTTPTGRILNRLSKDFETIDTAIGMSFSITLKCLCSVLLSVLTVIAISPVFIIPGTFIAFTYVSISKIYLETSRPLKRLDSTTLSPIFASYRTTLEGLVTIRAFSAEHRFIDRMINKLDVTTKCYWSYWMMNRWTLVRFDSLGALTVLIVMSIVVAFGGNTAPQIINLFGSKVVAFQGKTGVSSGFEGLVIVSAMGFTMSVYWACRFLTQLELDLNSVERITEYLTLPQEPPYIIESNRPPAHWPSGTSSQEGFISVENLVIKYAPDLPPVLRGVSFQIKAQERVGLVGRTGSGKSTLATALLRFVEPDSGQIIIDGIDITSIGLFDLRSRVTFIQQDSVLFSGTIRENLDPFGDHTDEACLDVLRRVGLIDPSPTSTRPASIINADPAVNAEASPPSPTSTAGGDAAKQAIIKLDTTVTSSGSNFSHGQRQLIALARALLRKTSVVIMDEATSSIDFETDTKIQEALREEFGSSCVITIAHRLQTIMDYDRVIVMDAGTIVENGSPSELLADTDGVFHSMCVKAGITGAKES